MFFLLFWWKDDAAVYHFAYPVAIIIWTMHLYNLKRFFSPWNVWGRPKISSRNENPSWGIKFLPKSCQIRFWLSGKTAHSKTRGFSFRSCCYFSIVNHEIYTFSVDKSEFISHQTPPKSCLHISVFVPLISSARLLAFCFRTHKKRSERSNKKASTSCSCHWGDGAPPWGCGLVQLTDTTKHPGSGSPPLGAAASRDPDRNQGQEVGSRHPTPPGSVLRDLGVPKRSQNRTCSRWWFRWFLISMVRKHRCLFLMMSPRVESRSPVKSTSPTPHPKWKIWR